MQKVNIVCVGKIKESFYREAVAEYAKRLSRFVSFSVREIAEGKKLSSEALASELKKQYDRGAEVTFIIGSSCGLCDEVKNAADFRLSFSDMTFPHQLMRVILCEQIYRAYMINSGSEYHK